jgi:hypothetical protein
MLQQLRFTPICLGSSGDQAGIYFSAWDFLSLPPPLISTFQPSFHISHIQNVRDVPEPLDLTLPSTFTNFLHPQHEVPAPSRNKPTAKHSQLVLSDPPSPLCHTPPRLHPGTHHGIIAALPSRTTFNSFHSCPSLFALVLVCHGKCFIHYPELF